MVSINDDKKLTQTPSWKQKFYEEDNHDKIVQRLNVQINQVLRTPEIAARINQLGSSIVGNTSAEFIRQITLESEVWSSVVKKAGIAPE